MLLTPEAQNVNKLIEKHLSTMPFYIQEYIRAKKRSGLSPNTLLQYLYRYIHFLNWLLREAIVDVESIDKIPLSSLENLKKTEVELYIEYLREEEIPAEKNAKKHRGDQVVFLSVQSLKSLFNYLTKETETTDGECYFYRNVMSKIVLLTKKETANRRAEKISSVILNEEEIDDFLFFVENGYEHTLSNKLSRQRFLRDKERDKAILSLMLGSGIRVKEATQLELKKLI